MPNAFEQLEEKINSEILKIEEQLQEIKMPVVLLPLIKDYTGIEDSFWEEQFSIYFPITVQEAFRIEEEKVTTAMNALFQMDDLTPTIYEKLEEGNRFREEQGDCAKIVFKKQYYLFLQAAKSKLSVHQLNACISPALRDDKTFALASRGHYHQFNLNLLSDREVAWSVLTNFTGNSASAEEIFPNLSTPVQHNKKFWFDVIKIRPQVKQFLAHITNEDDNAFLLAVSPAIENSFELIALSTLEPSLSPICQHYQNDKVLAQAANYDRTFLWLLLIPSPALATAILMGILILTSVVIAPVGLGIGLTATAGVIACGLFGKTMQHQRAVNRLRAEACRRFLNNPLDEDPDNSSSLTNSYP
ncbi:MAG: hypothetical protein H0U75_10440 [Legionella sp.]|nr:hypothetical protein [Legionella sp.]